MCYFVYILYSKKLSRYYVGSTNDIDRRIYEHNIGHGKYSRKGSPWQLVYIVPFETKKEAVQEELRIKRRKSRRFIERLISER